MLGVNPHDPTKGIILIKDENPRSVGSLHNDFKYTLEELSVIYDGLMKIYDAQPYPVLACLMLMATGMRKATVCKLTYDMITEDENQNPILKIPRSILKGRSRDGQKDEIHDITDSVRDVLNMCIAERTKKNNYKYLHTNFIFPSKLIDPKKIMDRIRYPDYASSHTARLSERTLDDTWKRMKKVTGIKQGAVKSLRKTFSSYAVEIGEGAHKGKLLTRHKSQQILEINYDKSRRAEVTELAQKLDHKYTNIIKFRKSR